jgi:uncharacterized membrane protein YfcA
MMLLLVLTSVLGYELKTAVGTSVFIMTFTALTGAISHFYIGGAPDIPILIACVISTLVFAQIGAKWANGANVKMLNGNFALCAGAGDVVFLTTSTDTLEVSKYDLTKSRKSLASMVKNNKQRIGLRISAAI